MADLFDDYLNLKSVPVEVVTGSGESIKNQDADVHVQDGKIFVYEPNSNKTNLILELKLSGKCKIKIIHNLSDASKESKASTSMLRIADDQGRALTLRSNDVSTVKRWKEFISCELIFAHLSAKSMNRERSSRSLISITHENSMRSSNLHPTDSDDEEEVVATPAPVTSTTSTIPPPVMNIVILVVGTRGDVQPFVYFGQSLQRDGHRVRLATHSDYREDVQNGGLEYYPLAGDPKKLSEYMVKTAGRLMPDILNKREMRELPEKLTMMKDIIYSCYPACTSPDPNDPLQRPFTADAIISNPVSYGHIHCAEALGIPLHIMFPQPYAPTREFPHPMVNIGFSSRWSSMNKLSYRVFDYIWWLALGPVVKRFRRDVLKLEPVQFGELDLHDSKVPVSHMWSPSFVPKAKDWPDHVDVVGEFILTSSGNSTFNAPQQLVDFLECGEEPLFIGFGSMVIENVTKLIEIVKAAADQVGCRVIMQSGWTKFGEDYQMISERVMVIGVMPHDWLFRRVAGVIHHGGAGTTSAGLRFGKPTFICPFFGDQRFWAEMVYRCGAGPKGCRIKDLTIAKMTEAFITLRSPETIAKAEELGRLMNREKDGIAKGLNSFYRNLPVAQMVCDVCIFDNMTSKLAKVFCTTCKLKMSTDADAVVHRSGGGRSDHIRTPYSPCRAGATNQASSLKSSISHLLSLPMNSGKVLMQELMSGSCMSMNESDEEKVILADDSSMAVKFVDEDIVSIPDRMTLSNADLKIERAFLSAKKLEELWEKIGRASSGDEIDMDELRSVIPSDEVIKKLLMNSTGAEGPLSFTEVAWMVANVGVATLDSYSVDYNHYLR